MDNSTRNFLVEKEQEQGFLTKNDIFDYVDKYNLPLDELERLCGLLVDKGTIIQEKQEKEFLDHESSYTSSKNKVDYEKIFKRALNIDCSLIPYINKLKRIQHPRRGEADKLIHQAKKGNSFARRRLVNISLKYVVKLAIWYHDKYDYPLADTIQEGNIGIIKAIEKIPLQGNRKFVTYFPWWSKQVIGRNLNEFNWLIRIPAYIHSDLFKIHKVAKRH
jgi:RNA polymerase primary sigma factor